MVERFGEGRRVGADLLGGGTDMLDRCYVPGSTLVSGPIMAAMAGVLCIKAAFLQATSWKSTSK